MTINDLNYERFLADATVPVMLVFRASFCGPSAMLEPLIEQAAKDFDGQVVVADIDVEDCPNLTRQFQVKNTPTLVVLHLGVPVASIMGTMNYEQLTEFVKRSICKEPKG